MKSLAPKALLSIIFLLLIPISTYAFNYVLGEGVYQKPTIPKPAKGETIIDPNFNTKITRITDKDIDGYSGTAITPYYGRANPENADGTRLLLSGKEWSWYLYNVNPPFNLIKKIDPKILGYTNSWDGGPIEAQWDSYDPNIFYYILNKGEIPQENKATFNMYNVTTDTRTVLHDFKNEFPTATFIGTQTEGDPSSDGRYWSFFVKGSGGAQIATIVYDKDQDQIIKQWDNPECMGDHLTMSPDGDYVFISHSSCNNLYGRSYKISDFPTGISMCCGGHADNALTVTGDQIYWRQDQTYDCVGMSDFAADGGRWQFFSPCGSQYSPYCAGMEFSGNNYDKPGWGVVSFYGANGGWWDNQIMMVELNKGKCNKKKIPKTTGTWEDCATEARIWRIAHTHSPGTNYWTYWATINRKGTKIYFGSEWDEEGGQIETYMVELPESWWEDLRTPNPNFFICSYQFNDEDAAAIASMYGFIVTSLSESSSVATMKTINSETKALYYDNALTHGDDYYVYDTITGKKIVHDDWDWYLHDISNPNYQTSLANYIASNLDSHPQFDGIFLDDAWHSINPSIFHQEGTSEDPNLPADLVDNWQTYMISLIKAVKSAIASDLLILNCSWYMTDYIAEADGLMDEWFAHANWQGPTEFYSTSSWKDSIDSLITVVSSNKYYLAQSGVSDGATQEEIDKIVSYCYCSFLMGIPSNNNFAKHYFCPSLTYSNYYWYSDWETNLGRPVVDYFEVPGTTDCYRRNFEDGIVLVNPTDNATGNIDLGGTFNTLEGNPVTQVNLSAREGTILLNNTLPTATITSPSDGSIHIEGASIAFSGSGDDAEDGGLTGSSLVWTSDIDGQIGTGTSFTKKNLSTATHTITLTATDSQGATGQASISITVGEDNDGGGGGRCFIATAAFGSDMARHVKILSEFRDKRLVTNSIGRGIINTYCTFSPHLADYLHKHPFARDVVRYALIPLTGIAYISLYIPPFVLLFAFILLLLAVVYCVRCLPRSRGNFVL